MTDPLKLVAALCLVVLAARTLAWGQTPAGGSKVFPYPIHETVLENGLKVVAVPIDSPGLVAYWTVVRAGSRNEIEPGKSGFAHFFEHMMFRGTERFSREKYNDVLKRIGAEHNAFTTDDYTAYHILGPASALDTIMDLEADRFMTLKYSVEDFKKEAGAVLGEYNKNASSPFQTLNEKVRDAAFTAHPYKHTTIGFLRDVKDMPNQFDYSLVFFDRWYRPENCIVLAVGDVDPARLVDLARRHYGPWKRGTFTLRVPDEPPQTREQRVAVPWPNPTLPYLSIAYHAPAFSTTVPDMPALDVASQLLFSEAAPLYQKLVVEDQVVDILTGGAPDHRDPYLFTVLARVKDPARIGAVETAITSALEGLAAAPAAADRLDKVKSALKYSFAMSLDTAASAAQNLAHYLALTADPESVNRVYALYDRITPEQVQAAAARYFVPVNRTVVILAHGPVRPAGPAAGEPEP